MNQEQHLQISVFISPSVEDKSNKQEQSITEKEEEALKPTKLEFQDSNYGKGN